MISRIFFSLLAIGLGIAGLKYNFQLVNGVARLEFFERNLGAGSTYLVYKVGSIALVIGGILYLTGFGPAVLAWLLAPLAALFPGN
jgi:hypothetical protein